MKPVSKRTVLTLANAIEVAAGTLHELSGADTTTTLSGQPITRATLADMMTAHIQRRFAKHVSRPVK